MAEYPFHLGVAGWSLPKDFRHLFPEEGSHLQRFAQVFDSVEINSSFYREHQRKTYERWARETPEHFRFSVKLARALLHDCRMDPEPGAIRESVENILGLGPKLGAILVQIPGSLEFDPRCATAFFSEFREAWTGAAFFEPRNTTWLRPGSLRLLRDLRISKVIADPDRCPYDGPEVLRATGAAYWRLHGTPEIYRSSYDADFLAAIARQMEAGDWCMFDNTTFGHAITNALQLREILSNNNKLDKNI